MAVGMPSGQWGCVWQQDDIVHVERELRLTFAAGQFGGGGRDGEGHVAYAGTLGRRGRVRLVKHHAAGEPRGADLVCDRR